LADDNNLIISAIHNGALFVLAGATVNNDVD